jgi:hypothetical protein
VAFYLLLCGLSMQTRSGGARLHGTGGDFVMEIECGITEQERRHSGETLNVQR